MNPYKELLKKYNLVPLGYRMMNKNQVVSTTKGDFFIKEKKRGDKNNLYQYLTARSFPYFLPAYNKIEEDPYEVYPFIKEVNTPDEQKAIDLIYLLSLLHNKTTFYKDMAIDDIKELYESIGDKIYYLDNYYHSLQDIIESHVYMAPSEYFLIRHISKIYQALYYSKTKLDEWYKIMEEKKKMRYVMIYNNADLSHLIEGENPLLISWDQAKIDLPIYDLLLFYERLCPKVDFTHLFDLYQSKYPLLKEEINLFEILISIPDKYEPFENEYQNALRIYQIYQKLKRSSDFLLKQHPSNSTN